MDNDDTDNDSKLFLPTGYVINDKPCPQEYVPLFKWFYDQRLFYIPFKNENCRLPVLLKLIHSMDVDMYKLFKQFYNLTDESMKDDDYTREFLIDIWMEYYDGDEKDDKKYCTIHTRFGITLNKEGSYIIIKRQIYEKSIIDFQSFIDYCENEYSKEHGRTMDYVNGVKKVVQEWKESLFNKEYVCS